MWIFPVTGIVRCLKQRKKRFGKFTEEYLFSRESIAVIILLVDIRHKPTQNDIIMHEYIKNTGKPYLIIANKADKIATTKVDERISEIRQELKLADEEILLPFSSERKIYMDDVWKKLEFEP